MGDLRSMGMRIDFSKWEGTGNDFIVLDDRNGIFPGDDAGLVGRLCHRHFGIGSDGILLIQRPELAGTAYHVDFLNPDGSRSFCGNGSRCGFAFWRGLMGDDPIAEDGAHAAAVFTAIDGAHDARMAGESVVAITMSVPGAIERIADDVDLVDTGSPHLLVWVGDPGSVDILVTARHHRNGPRFAKHGVNVNFLTVADGRVRMRTYERGVEDETLSCGTGVTAAALGAVARGLLPPGEVCVDTRGGQLRVVVPVSADPAGPVSLVGPVREVFTGSMTL